MRGRSTGTCLTGNAGVLPRNARTEHPMAFDIDRYTSTSTSVAWQDLDFGEFKTNPLPPATLRSLRYMCDIEYHTVCYLRDLLVTPSHKEADVSAFMTMWNREEFW